VISSTPGGSERAVPVGSRDSSSRRGPSTVIAIPTGRFAMKTDRQPQASTSSPPMVGPSAAASAPAAL
jgi:hypothetical protein